jgi:TolB protein
MMTTRICLTALVAALLVATGRAYPDGVIVAESLPQRQQNELELSLVNPGANQRIGLPDFVVPPNDPDLAAAATTVADVLWDDINFEREFYMIPRQESASIPAAPATALPYDRWSQLGADFVLAGEASRNGDQIVVNLRMIAVRGDLRGRQHFGRAYPNCRLEQLRFCAHAIADDFHKEVAALDGVARTKIAFSSDRDATRVTGRPSQNQISAKEIYVSDYDGANPQRLTVNRSLNISPAWGASGSVLAYTSYSDNGFPDIFIANLREPGRGLRRPAQGNDKIHNQLASISPDGTKLAFMSNRTGDFDIWVVNSDGTGLRNLTNYPRAADGAPTWSPDGAFIAFTSDRNTGTTPQLFVMTADGTNQRRLATERIDRPTWSRLNFIAFTVGPGSGQNIGLLDMNNQAGGVIVLTDGRGTNESPAVAPNGRHIAFVTTRWGRSHVAIVDRDGRHYRQVTRVGNNGYPNWQPITAR